MQVESQHPETQARTAPAEARGDRLRRHGRRTGLYTWAFGLVALLVDARQAVLLRSSDRGGRQDGALRLLPGRPRRSGTESPAGSESPSPHWSCTEAPRSELEDARHRELLPLFPRGGADQAFQGYEAQLERLESEPGVRQQR
jgi:hypothetical protein